MLKAGVARVDITPPLGTYIPGYFFARYAKGVDDPLELNTVALSDGEECVVVISADILMIKMIHADKIRAYISEKTGIKAENIMIACAHQHTAFDIRGRGANHVLDDKAFLDVLYRKFADVAKMAVDDLKEAELFVGERETDEKIAFIRRYIMKSGKIETNPNDRYLEVDRPYRKADNTVKLLKFVRREGSDIALIGFSTHADVIHRERFSADWVGAARRYVENDLDGVSAVVLVGAQGDSNHADFTIPQYKDGYEHSMHMGRVIADTVVKMWNDGEKTEVDKISAGIELVYNRTRTDGEEKYEEMKAFLEESKKNPDKTGSNITELGNASRIIRLRDESIYQKVPVTAFNVGKVGFVGFGGEPFTQYIDNIKEGAPDRFIIGACCANGGEGYLPTEKAFSEGGYEAGSSPFSQSLERECTEAALTLLSK